MLSPRNLLLALLALALCPALHAQTTTVSSLADYTGPRYPGGPDSLRALVCRSTRQAGPTPAGHALVQFELTADGQPTRYTLITPPGRATDPLAEAATNALRYLEVHMPAWQPGTTTPEATPGDKFSRINVVLDFAAPTVEQAYTYAEQQPVFGTLAQLVPSRHGRYMDDILNDPIKRAQFQSSARGLVTFCQLQVRYPPEALRAHQQGTVYASFEVSESGAIERSEILGSVGRSLDVEVLRVLATLPAATAPAQLRGQPVRVRYVLPLTFRIQ
ncbi:TonB family protein [Hymenobacter sp. UYCo722]|uniref:TonB family protein n=1 Tax=Hymenobacter sp. UYCo722 TaxID=3156335 RepID=UPI003393CF2F